MAKDFKGKIDLDIRDSEPDWAPYATDIPEATAKPSAVTRPVVRPA